MTTSSRSRVQVYVAVPQLFRRNKWTRARIVLLAWTTGFGFTAAGCREADAGRASNSLSPASTASRTASISAADSAWDTYSAVVTIHTEGTRFKGPTGRDAVYHLTRTLEADSSWRTVIGVVARKNAVTGEVSDPARKLGRIEMDAGGVRSYDGLGNELVQRGPNLESQAAAVHARHPESGPFPFMNVASAGTVPPVPPGARRPRSGRAWADGVFAGPATGDRARARNTRIFGSKAERVGSQYRYVRTKGNEKLEVLVDSLTGVPMEVKETRSGVLAVRIVHSYDHRPDGSNILRETRVERPATTGGGLATTVTRFDSVTFSRRGAGR